MFSVLYLDDDSALLDLARIFLEMSGKLRVDTAQSVGEALDKIKHRKFDGIISDYEMPAINGVEFLRHIRLHHPSLPFVLFTGRGREEIAIEALNNGADFYLQKGGNPKSQFAELESNLLHAIDRKQARDDLTESRLLMANLIDFLPDATFAINRENMVISWNRMMETMTGIPASAILGTEKYAQALARFNEARVPLVDRVLNPDTGQAVADPSLTREGSSLISEFYSPALHDGKGAHLWLIASPLCDTNGNAIGAIESIRDITARKVAEEKLKSTYEELNASYEQLTATEEELRANYNELTRGQQELYKSEERYRNVVEDQTEFICRFLPDESHIFVNDAYCRYFGKTREEIIGHRFTPEIPKEDLPILKAHFALITPDDPVQTVEHRIRMPNGEIRWQQWSDRAVFDRNGKVTEYQSVGRDITEQKEAVKRLKRTHEELNASYEQLTATEEELRQNYEELTKSQHELQKSEERYRNVVEDQTEFICRFLPDGSHIFVNDAYCRYFGKTREEIVGHRFAPDIPKEDLPILKMNLASITPDHPVQTVEHRIRMPNGEIRWQQWSDRAVFDRNGKVTEYQSVGRDVTDRKRTEQALHEANKKLTLLSSITRHDILNQLTGLQGYIGLIEAKITDPAIRTLVHRAFQSSEVIRDQISFTKQYEDIGVQSPNWQNVSSLVTEVCRDNRFPTVAVDPFLTDLEVFADPLLKLVFSNLFENARMHGKTVTKIVVSGTVSPDGAEVTVADDGKGIPLSEKQKIFEKGFGSHTGLGLYLAQEILSITDLTIRETGEPGRGARFVIHIPKGAYRATPAAQPS
jgi:PAS domain S-box-containing protein